MLVQMVEFGLVCINGSRLITNNPPIVHNVNSNSNSFVQVNTQAEMVLYKHKISVSHSHSAHPRRLQNHKRAQAPFSSLARSTQASRRCCPQLFPPLLPLLGTVIPFKFSRSCCSLKPECVRSHRSAAMCGCRCGAACPCAPPSCYVVAATGACAASDGDSSMPSMPAAACAARLPEDRLAFSARTVVEHVWCNMIAGADGCRIISDDCPSSCTVSSSSLLRLALSFAAAAAPPPPRPPAACAAVLAHPPLLMLSLRCCRASLQFSIDKCRSFRSPLLPPSPPFSPGIATGGVARRCRAPQPVLLRSVSVLQQLQEMSCCCPTDCRFGSEMAPELLYARFSPRCELSSCGHCEAASLADFSYAAIACKPKALVGTVRQTQDGMSAIGVQVGWASSRIEGCSRTCSLSSSSRLSSGAGRLGGNDLPNRP